MATYAKLLNGLTDLGIHKMQEHLEYYIDLVNKGQQSYGDLFRDLWDSDPVYCRMYHLYNHEAGMDPDIPAGFV